MESIRDKLIVVFIILTVAIGFFNLPAKQMWQECRQTFPPISTEEPEIPEDIIEVMPPCPGVTNPGAIVYVIDQGELKIVRTMKDDYFQCVVLKKMNIENEVYYLIVTFQPGFIEEYHIVDTSGVTLYGKYSK